MSTELPVAASTFPYLYSHSGVDAAMHLADMGYDAIEMMIFPPHCWPVELDAQTRKDWKARMDDRGLKITSFCYPLLDNNPNSVDRIMRRYTIDRYREAIDLSAEWNCPYVVCIPGPVNSLINPPDQWMLDWFVEGAKEIVGHAKDTGVTILLENVPFTFLPSAEDMKRVCAMIDDSVGVNFDVCNSAYIKEDVPGAIKLLGPLVRNVHISDSGYGDFKHDRLGTGIVEPGPAAEALKEIGYSEYTVLEIIADAMQPETDPDGDIKASRDILTKSGWAAH